MSEGRVPRTPIFNLPDNPDAAQSGFMPEPIREPGRRALPHLVPLEFPDQTILQYPPQMGRFEGASAEFPTGESAWNVTVLEIPSKDVRLNTT
jgi:hypothetical protein